MKPSNQAEYLTIQDFAERAGVSNQAVYDRIKKDLSKYATKIGGRMMISVSALDFIGNKVDSQAVKVESSAKSSDSTTISSKSSSFSSDSSKILEKQSNNQSNTADKTSKPLENQSNESSLLESKQVENPPLLDYLTSEIDRLREEIKKKDAQIEEKDKMIAGYAEKFANYVEQMAAIAQKEQEISARALEATGRAQYLQAISEQSETVQTIETEQGREAPKKPWWKRKRK